MSILTLLGYARPYRLALAIIAGLMLAQTLAVLMLPWLGGRLAAGFFDAKQPVDVDSVLLGIIGLFAIRSIPWAIFSSPFKNGSAAFLASKSGE